MYFSFLCQKRFPNFKLSIKSTSNQISAGALRVWALFWGGNETLHFAPSDFYRSLKPIFGDLSHWSVHFCPWKFKIKVSSSHSTVSSFPTYTARTNQVGTGKNVPKVKFSKWNPSRIRKQKFLCAWKGSNSFSSRFLLQFWRFRCKIYISKLLKIKVLISCSRYICGITKFWRFNSPSFTESMCRKTPEEKILICIKTRKLWYKFGENTKVQNSAEKVPLLLR